MFYALPIVCAPPPMLGHGPPMTVLFFELRTNVFKGLLKQRI